MRITVRKEFGKPRGFLTVMDIDIETLVQLSFLQHGTCLPLPYELEVTLSDGRSEKKIIEEFVD